MSFLSIRDRWKKIMNPSKKENPMVSIFCGDFNARSPLFWEGDTENKEGRICNDFLMSSHLQPLI